MMFQMIFQIVFNDNITYDILDDDSQVNNNNGNNNDSDNGDTGNNDNINDNNHVS